MRLITTAKYVSVAGWVGECGLKERTKQHSISQSQQVSVIFSNRLARVTETTAKASTDEEMRVHVTQEVDVWVEV